jgi:hypothetical protein
VSIEGPGQAAARHLRLAAKGRFFIYGKALLSSLRYA